MIQCCIFRRLRGPDRMNQSAEDLFAALQRSTRIFQAYHIEVVESESSSIEKCRDGICMRSNLLVAGAVWIE